VDVGGLPFHVDGAHVYRAWHPQPRTGRGTRDAVLAGTGLRDDALRPGTLGEQRLTEGVVDLVRARVREVLALQPDPRAPALRKPSGERQGCWAAGPGRELPRQILLEGRRVQVLPHTLLQPLERRNQRLRDIAPAEWPEAATGIGEPP